MDITYETEFLESEPLYTGDGEKLWVAVVDDDEMNLKLAERILTKNDINVTKLVSGKELLDFLKDNHPD